jgi:hypothetical protein
MGLNLNWGLNVWTKNRYINGPAAIFGRITKGYNLVMIQRNSLEIKLKDVTA